MTAIVARGPAPDLLPEPWTEDAACRDADPSVFYPARRDHAAPEAIAVCASCPVRDECLRYALDRDEPHGIWGGLTPHQRDQIKRRQAKHQAA